jgi:C1A family cysteine protease
MNKHIYNLKPTPIDHKFHTSKLKVEAPSTTPLPVSIDLRGSGLFDPIYDQSSLGSCESNASSAAFNYELRFQGLPPLLPNPSRLFHYYTVRTIENTINEDSGASLGDGCSALEQQGICAESIWPYNIDQFTVKPLTECYTSASANILVQFNGCQNVTDIQQSLANKKPVVIGIVLYDSFESDEVAKTGIVPLPDITKEQLLGGHAVLVVGYDNTKQWFIVRNSWGNWGDRGYCYIPYQYINTYMSEAYTMTIVK